MIFILVILGVLLLTFLIVATSHTRIIKIYNKYSKINNSSYIKGGEFALLVLDKYNLDLNICLTEKKLGDAYSASQKLLVFYTDTFHETSLASVTIAAHELGHALQFKENYPLFPITSILSRLTMLTNKLIFPLLIAGLATFAFISTVGATTVYTLLGLSAGFFVLNIVNKFLTIPLEKDASKRGLKLLKELKILNKAELRGARKFLNVASQTYISSFFDGFLPFSKELRNIMNKKRR